MLKTSSKYSPGPGAVLGPMLADVDAPGELVKDLGTHNQADVLINYHAQLYPGELIQKLALPRDTERSAALDLEEVHEALCGLQGSRAFFDEEGDTLLDASVKGDPGVGYVVSVIFSVPSGRTVRGVIPYDKVPQSARAFEERQEQEAQAASFFRGFQDRPVGSASSSDAASQASADRLEQLERRVRESEEAQASALEELERHRDPEPWTGYDEADASTVTQRVSDGGAAEFGRAGLRRIAEYEERHKNRVSVTRAVEAAVAAQKPE